MEEERFAGLQVKFIIGGRKMKLKNKIIPSIVIMVLMISLCTVPAFAATTSALPGTTSYSSEFSMGSGNNSLNIQGTAYSGTSSGNQYMIVQKRVLFIWINASGEMMIPHGSPAKPFGYTKGQYGEGVYRIAFKNAAMDNMTVNYTVKVNGTVVIS